MPAGRVVDLPLIQSRTGWPASTSSARYVARTHQLSTVSKPDAARASTADTSGLALRTHAPSVLRLTARGMAVTAQVRVGSAQLSERDLGSAIATSASAPSGWGLTGVTDVLTRRPI